jgi:hypothetical protein
VFQNFPRHVGDPKRRVVNSRKELMEWLKPRNGIVNCFIGVYGLKEIEEGRIDKIFIDIDGPYEEMYKLHKWLKDSGYKHAVFFSGGGYHVYIFTTISHLDYPANALRNAQIYITETAGVAADRQVYGDLMRVTRLPNTYNPRRGRYCIPLSGRIIRMGESHILGLAENQLVPSEKIFIGSKLYDLTPFDQPPNISKVVADTSEYEEIEINDDMVAKFAPCVKALLSTKRPSHRDRFFVAAYLKEWGLTVQEIYSIFKMFFASDVYYHALVEGQVENIFEKDILFPSCDTMQKEGKCAEPTTCPALRNGSPF